jgi:hypothetical protein
MWSCDPTMIVLFVYVEEVTKDTVCDVQKIPKSTDYFILYKLKSLKHELRTRQLDNMNKFYQLTVLKTNIMLFAAECATERN